MGGWVCEGMAGCTQKDVVCTWGHVAGRCVHVRACAASGNVGQHQDPRGRGL